MLRLPPRSTRTDPLFPSTTLSDLLAASQSPVFLINSRHPLVCAPHTWLPRHGAPFSRSYGGNLPSSFSIVLSSALVCSTSPPVSVSGTVYKRGLFPGTASRPGQSNKPGQLTPFVTTRRSTNINLFPIDYGFLPRLRRSAERRVGKGWVS